MTAATFTKNPGVKLLAIVIAVALWVLVTGEEEAVKVYTVPLDFALSRGQILEGETPDSVQVRVRGSESILRSLAPDALRIPVDLTGAIPGRKVSKMILPDSVQGIPSGAAVDTVTPDHMTLAVGRKITARVQVAPRLEGAPASGYRMDKVDARPDTVTVEGAESEVSSVSVAHTDPISLHGKDETFTVRANLALDSPRLRIIEAQSVEVTVHIAKDETQK